MEVRRCENGHFYDAEANSSCPQCAAEMGMGAGDSMKTMFSPEFEDFGPTMPGGGFEGSDPGRFESYGPTEPSGGFGGDGSGQVGGIGKTESVHQGSGFDNDAQKTFQMVQDYDSVTEVADMRGGSSNFSNQGKLFSPTAGWLVCTEGPARGMDYRIRCGYNYIGRSEHMDICIRGDNRISRERHALVAYDQEERVFFFGPADGKSIVRVNGKMVMGPTGIQAYDIVSVGATKLLFVPLCGERFNWDE